MPNTPPLPGDLVEHARVGVGDVLAEHADALVARHLLVQREPDRLAERHRLVATARLMRVSGGRGAPGIRVEGVVGATSGRGRWRGRGGGPRTRPRRRRRPPRGPRPGSRRHRRGRARRRAIERLLEQRRSDRARPRRRARRASGTSSGRRTASASTAGSRWRGSGRGPAPARTCCDRVRALACAPRSSRGRRSARRGGRGCRITISEIGAGAWSADAHRDRVAVVGDDVEHGEVRGGRPCSGSPRTRPPRSRPRRATRR